MKTGFRQTMALLHSWAGLIPGWLLYAIFLTGSLSYYRQEISQWMQPELFGVVPSEQALAVGMDWLTRQAPDAALWRIDLPTPRDPVLTVMSKTQAGGGFVSDHLDPSTGLPLAARATRGGDFLYYFHFDLNLPWRIGRWIVCFCAVIMLVALVSGVITHRRIFTDFGKFRPGRGQRSWLDAHNFTGVLALPYHVLIAYTGLVTLATMYMPWGIERAYPSDSAAYYDDLAGRRPTGERSGVGAPLTPLPPLLAEARRQWSGGEPGRILIHNPRDAAAVITVVRRDSDTVSYDLASISFGGATGKQLAVHDHAGPAAATHGVLYGLHLARFAPASLRAFMFTCGLFGTAMIATGLILWIGKRRSRIGRGGAAHRGFRVAERLNVAVIAGLPIAIAVFLLSNRLLPADLAGRAQMEVYAFFGGWLAAAAHAMLRRLDRVWIEQCAAIAALAFCTPLASALTTGTGLQHTLLAGDGQRAGVDLALIAAGVFAAVITRYLHRRPRAEQSVRQ